MVKNTNATIELTSDEADLARQSGEALLPYVSRDELRLELPNKGRSKKPLVLSKAVVGLLIQILREMADGNAVALVPMQSELTTQQAADLLGVSRPFIVSQIRSKRLPSRKIGTHHRVLFRDLAAYKKRMESDRLATLEELAREAQELHFGY